MIEVTVGQKIVASILGCSALMACGAPTETRPLPRIETPQPASNADNEVVKEITPAPVAKCVAYSEFEQRMCNLKRSGQASTSRSGSSAGTPSDETNWSSDMLGNNSERWEEVEGLEELRGELEGMDGDEIIEYLEGEGYLEDD